MPFNEHDIPIKSMNKRASDTQKFLKLLASKSFSEQLGMWEHNAKNKTRRSAIRHWLR